jgi:DNA-binding response OmpR family regulator
MSQACTPRELLARIRAILRRIGNQAQPAHEIDMLREGPLTMWPGERRAQWGDTVLELTSTEYSLLELLVRNAGQPVGKDILSKQALDRRWRALTAVWMCT